MKKIIVIVFLVLLSIIIYINNDKEKIRLRIISNGDEDSDIILKNEVKNATIYFLEEIYVDNYDEYVDNINKSLEELEYIIDSNYIDCNIEFDNHTLYNKEYNDDVIRNESTLTLVITLGTGEGNNWWGTIYPEYLGMEGTDVVEYESLFVNLINYIKGKDEK